MGTTTNIIKTNIFSNYFNVSENIDDRAINNSKYVQVLYKQNSVPNQLIKYHNSDDIKGFDKIQIEHFRDTIKNDEDKLVYEIFYRGKYKEDNNQDKKDFELYDVKTGIFIGLLNFDVDKKQNINLKIDSGYSDVFLKHMLNYALNIYVKGAISSKKTVGENSELVLYYRFLKTLQKSITKGFPKSLKIKEYYGVGIKGQIDINKYINHDVFYSYKLTSIFQEIFIEQEIVDIIYKALSVIDNRIKIGVDRNLLTVEKQLKILYSKKRIVKKTFKKALTSKGLRNPMYKEFKDLIRYAEIILNHHRLVEDDKEGFKGVSGYLLNISELWEVYLYKILSKKLNLEGYKIEPQFKMELYKGTFFERSNYPDIVIKDSNGKIVAVIDAKFKRMNFENGDVDRSDIHQMHSYSLYFKTKEKYNNDLKLVSLVYPSKEEKGGKTTECELCGIEGENTMFSILSIKIPNIDDEKSDREQINQFEDEIKKAENEFVESIRGYLV